MEEKTVLLVSGEYDVLGDQLMSFARREGILSVLRVKEISNETYKNFEREAVGAVREHN